MKTLSFFFAFFFTFR
ncbi:hypothetical protein [Erwinia pyri]